MEEIASILTEPKYLFSIFGLLFVLLGLAAPIKTKWFEILLAKRYSRSAIIGMGVILFAIPFLETIEVIGAKIICHPADLLTPWENHGGEFSEARYCRKGGIVYLMGVISKGKSKQAAFVLHKGFRPSKTLIFNILSSHEGPSRVDVKNNGEIFIETSGNQFVSLSGIQFVAEK